MNSIKYVTNIIKYVTIALFLTLTYVYTKLGGYFHDLVKKAYRLGVLLALSCGSCPYLMVLTYFLAEVAIA